MNRYHPLDFIEPSSQKMNIGAVYHPHIFNAIPKAIKNKKENKKISFTPTSIARDETKQFNLLI